MKVLVTGASGYVGSRLVPRLLAEGHDVRAAFTDPGRAVQYWWAPDAEVVGMNVLEAGTVTPALEGVESVYYLVHGMAGRDFAETDRIAATTMSRACDDAGVGRIVYLGGLVPDVPEEELSEHISSRLEVERILGSASTTVITLRAAIVLGAGSTSFEIVRQISERLPVRAVPDWMDSRVQPIAVTDLVEALVATLAVDTATRHYDVGGPERMPYPDLLRAYARVAGLTRPQVPVVGLPTDVVGLLTSLLTDVPSATVQALVGSLHHDMVCHECDFTSDLIPEGHQLLTVEEALRRALRPPRRGVPARDLDPLGAMPHDPAWAGGSGGGIPSVVSAATSVVSKSLGELGRGRRR